jgi:phasin family protein
MADSDDPKVEAPAEAAQAAAEALPATETPKAAETPTAEISPASGEPAEVPAKPKRGRKPRVAADTGAATRDVADEPATEPMIEVPAGETAPIAEAAAKPPRHGTSARPVEASAGLTVEPNESAPLPVRKPAVQKAKTATKTVTPSKAVPENPALTAQLKETPMDETSTFQDAVEGAQEKTKDVFTKTTAFVGEYGEFAKGNVEAFVESSKILASGLQDLGSKFIAESKNAIETMTSEVKELSAAKTPTDFFKIQTDLLRRNFDSAIAYGSKTSEAVLKLTNDVIAPISGRVNLAVEKVRKAA